MLAGDAATKSRTPVFSGVTGAKFNSASNVLEKFVPSDSGHNSQDQNLTEGLEV